MEYSFKGRIGKKGLRARPVRIMVEDDNQRRKMLMRARELKRIQGMENVYISADLTRVQQEEGFRARREWRREVEAGEESRVRGGEASREGEKEEGEVVVAGEESGKGGGEESREGEKEEEKKKEEVGKAGNEESKGAGEGEGAGSSK